MGDNGRKAKTIMDAAVARTHVDREIDNIILGWSLALLEMITRMRMEKLEPATSPFLNAVLCFNRSHPGCHAAVTVDRW